MTLAWASAGALCALLGCSSARPASVTPAHLAAGNDANACERICAASAACGDDAPRCAPKCNEWLVARARPGIAGITARCAVPRIDRACGAVGRTGSAALALVSCIDDAGRGALAKDSSSLLVAARAICARGARCDDGSAADAARCVDTISAGSVPRGLGIFGAMKPHLVRRFAACMDAADCGTASGVTHCIGDMLGESSATDDATESDADVGEHI